MNFKKLILGLTLTAFLTAPVLASTNSATTRTMISQYKAKNYLGCLQTTQSVIEKNPSDIYAHYYQGLAYIQLGKKTEAMDAFAKVVALNSNDEIVQNAQKSVACMTSPEACTKAEETIDDFDRFINSNKFYTEKVQSEINQKKLDKLRQDMNEEAGKKKSEQPTNEEIANAVKTLAKVGFNPMNSMNMYQSPEMMQMEMLLGNNSNNNNNMNNMLPYLLMGQNQNGTNNISPELIQTMMMSQMQMY